MNSIVYYFLLFMIYSIIGWIVETVFVALNSKKLVNRGFFMGPYCPIYGIGSVLIVVLLKGFQNNILVLFILATVICSVVEYLISYMMEKIFKARWWDYSHLPFNINGRIYLGNTILFGIGGVIISRFNPYLSSFILSIPSNIAYIVFCVLVASFGIDMLISIDIIGSIKMSADAIKKDYTGELNEKIRKILAERSRVLKRVLAAYPRVSLLHKKNLK